jgi:hypothetical protein
MLDKLGGLLGGASTGSVMSGGLRDLVENDSSRLATARPPIPG